MSSGIDYKIASPDHITKNLGERLAATRLRRNITQAELAERSGVAVRTLRRVEAGEGGTIDTLIRLLQALDLAQTLDLLVPDTSPGPMELARMAGAGGAEPRRRQRARKERSVSRSPWTWDDKETP